MDEKKPIGFIRHHKEIIYALLESRKEKRKKKGQKVCLNK